MYDMHRNDIGRIPFFQFNRIKDEEIAHPLFIFSLRVINKKAVKKMEYFFV